MRPDRSALLIVALGLLTFGAVFSVLEFSPSRAAPPQSVATPVTSPSPIEVAADSLAPRIQDGDLAVGVPVGGSESLLRDVQAGDRLDILASVSLPGQGEPITAVVVHGATVLRAPTSGDPLLVEVSGDDAVALAHLVLGGTRLGYVVWPTNATPPTNQGVMDDNTARTLLGLPTPAPAS